MGKNGCGKTNLLDAIYYLSFTKSAINPFDTQNIYWGQTGFMIKGSFQTHGQAREVTCSLQVGEKKLIREDGQDCERFSEHVGKYPVVLIAPQDIELIWDGSELRRKFFDTLICQVDKVYLENLIVSNHQLKQRNSLLRAAEKGPLDMVLLESYDQNLITSGLYIHEKRKSMLAGFVSRFRQHYQFLVANPAEEAEIQYKSDLSTHDFAGLLRSNLTRDRALQRTTVGIHRDDFNFLLHEQELKRVGSQGQQKSFLIGLKLAEFQILAEAKGSKPILLLDDIFDKLDDFRIQQLMKLVNQGVFGQLFITDARAGRCEQVLTEAGVEAQLYLLENGTFVKRWLGK